MDQAQVTTTYNTLLHCIQSYHAAQELLIDRKARLETARLGAIRDGLIIGKNEEERKASAYAVLKDLYHDVAVAEKDEREAKYALDCAQVLVEQTRALLRLEEITARVRETNQPPL